MFTEKQYQHIRKTKALQIITVTEWNDVNRFMLEGDKKGMVKNHNKNGKSEMKAVFHTGAIPT